MPRDRRSGEMGGIVFCVWKKKKEANSGLPDFFDRKQSEVAGAVSAPFALFQKMMPRFTGTSVKRCPPVWMLSVKRLESSEMLV